MQRETRPQRSNRAVAATVAAQSGVISRAQLHQAGVEEEAIRYRVRIGRLHQVFPGAFALSLPISTRARRIAALISTAPSFVSHRDAAEEHGFVDPIPGPVHVTVAHGRGLRREGIVVHRTRHLHRDERVEQGPLRLTSPARTLADIAGGMTRRRLTVAVDEGVRIGAFSAGEVVAACERSAGRPGTGVLLALAREPHLPFERTRSRPERRFLRFCADHGLPIPLVNVPLLGYEVDFLWPSSRLVVEMDSSHHDSPRARAADAERDARLGAAGYSVKRVRSARVRSGPETLAAELRSGLDALASRRLRRC